MKTLDEMLIELSEKLDIESFENHILSIAKRDNEQYYLEFIETMIDLNKTLNQKEFNDWFYNKMLINGEKFEERKFISFAVETTIVRYFSKFFPENFKVEVEVNKIDKKNIDLQFLNNNFIYNIEVKSADFNVKGYSNNPNDINIVTPERIPNEFNEYYDNIELIKNLLQTKSYNVNKVKRLDNTLLTYLNESNEKFGSNNISDKVNILYVGCNDNIDIQEYYSYLFGFEGLFTNVPFAKAVPNKYSNVDIVVLSNLNFKHTQFNNKNVTNNWELENCFNLIFENPHNNNSTNKKAIQNFYKTCPNYSNEFNSFIDYSPVPQEVKEITKINIFIKKILEKENNIYVFENKEDI